MSASLANLSAISTTHINDTALTLHSSTVVPPQPSDAIGRQRQPIIDLDSLDLTAAPRSEPFLDGCRVNFHILSTIASK